ncbi:MAG: hypothetical protein AAGF46_11685 [Pseudomonadota bacterium]
MQNAVEWTDCVLTPGAPLVTPAPEIATFVPELVASSPGRFAVPLTHLGGVAGERWLLDLLHAEPVSNVGTAEITAVESGDLLFCQAAIGEPDNLRAATQAVYEQLLNFIADAGYGHVVKAWNYLGDINAGAGDQERYKQFCAGRADAITALWPHEYLPAGTGVGAAEGAGLQVMVLASRTRPVLIENPRQVSAFHYPRQYGPRSPSFSRAAAIGSDDRQSLFISGTASIVGHESRHLDNLEAQVNETLSNIAALYQVHQERTGLTARWQERGVYRVYLRRPDYLEPVHAALVAAGFPVARCLYLQADICRAELLVEIDGVVPATR